MSEVKKENWGAWKRQTAKGETLGDEWSLVDEFEVDYEKEDEYDAEINFINENNKKSKKRT